MPCKIHILLAFCSLMLSACAKDENVIMTEVFEITLSPPMFNWTYEGDPHQFLYQPSLANFPDLPSWINYAFSQKHHCGFLYGVPPNQNGQSVDITVVALNRKTYETRVENVRIHVNEKLNPAKYEVLMKIDNLNVEDMFDVERMDRLKDIFRRTLWKDSQNDIYLTFLNSAVKLGARKPPNPDEGEGVVLRLGSLEPFSKELSELQEEVKPLWKVPSCPRDFKRTSVERFFRNAGFALDWCSFRLIEDNSSQKSIGTNEKLANSINKDYDRWETPNRADLPSRGYTHEFLVTILVPGFLLALLVLVLSLILCFHHEGISKRLEEVSPNEIMQYSTIQRATQSLRSLSNNREMSLSPDHALISHNSPTSTLNRGVHCRPSPPPYVRPKFKPDL